MRWRLVITVSLISAAVVALWVIHARQVGYWFQVHTGFRNESGPYYGFWSGFGSDLTEFGIIGAIATAAYQLFKRYNCHEPGCWRVGSHPAAGGQFALCYSHHPDYRGKKPTHELIERLHQQHLANQAVIHSKLHDVHQHLTGEPAATDGASVPGAPTAEAPGRRDAE